MNFCDNNCNFLFYQSTLLTTFFWYIAEMTVARCKGTDMNVIVLPIMFGSNTSIHG